ncbi:AlbA family DNA-binding domain-containing protein [Mycobacterium paraintracellulare]|uniref:AlbA family DNA-binding domain-containing protein n=1 Tax=Mycobacterium paraintracellulare TaxID=1138383 RepID=UPI00191512AB|nr:ATP-binding protein [Mycobacterium paraintracellulare]
MIVPDGHTDPEKLMQLVVAAEETHLDFKAVVDFSKTKDAIEFVKDAVAMANRPPGGYIVVGVDDAGNPCIPAGTLDNPSQFDGAKLNKQVRKFIDGEIHIVSQVHRTADFDYVLMWIPHHRDGLPVPMKATGQYRDEKGKDKLIFREGDVLVREGAENVPLRHAHWRDILREHDDQIRAEAERTAQRLLRTFLDERAQAASTKAPPPLLKDMDNDTFAAAVIEHLDFGDG